MDLSIHPYRNKDPEKLGRNSFPQNDSFRRSSSVLSAADGWNYILGKKKKKVNLLPVDLVEI